jgi:hypothetical protein
MSDFLIGLITVLIYVAVVATWFFSLFDLFVRGDLSGLAKALWLFAIVFVPILGVLAYFALRPRLPNEQLWWSSATTGENASNIYGQHNSDSVTGQIQTLAQLRKEGAISDEEFNRLKERALA